MGLTFSDLSEERQLGWHTDAARPGTERPTTAVALVTAVGQSRRKQRHSRTPDNPRRRSLMTPSFSETMGLVFRWQQLRFLQAVAPCRAGKPERSCATMRFCISLYLHMSHRSGSVQGYDGNQALPTIEVPAKGHLKLPTPHPRDKAGLRARRLLRRTLLIWASNSVEILRQAEARRQLNRRLGWST